MRAKHTPTTIKKVYLAFLATALLTATSCWAAQNDRKPTKVSVKVIGLKQVDKPIIIDINEDTTVEALLNELEDVIKKSYNELYRLNIRVSHYAELTASMKIGDSKKLNHSCILSYKTKLHSLDDSNITSPKNEKMYNVSLHVYKPQIKELLRLPQNSEKFLDSRLSASQEQLYDIQCLRKEDVYPKIQVLVHGKQSNLFMKEYDTEINMTLNDLFLKLKKALKNDEISQTPVFTVSETSQNDINETRNVIVGGHTRIDALGSQMNSASDLSVHLYYGKEAIKKLLALPENSEESLKNRLDKDKDTELLATLSNIWNKMPSQPQKGKNIESPIEKQAIQPIQKDDTDPSSEHEAVHEVKVTVREGKEKPKEFYVPLTDENSTLGNVREALQKMTGNGLPNLKNGTFLAKNGGLQGKYELQKDVKPIHKLHASNIVGRDVVNGSKYHIYLEIPTVTVFLDRNGFFFGRNIERKTYSFQYGQKIGKILSDNVRTDTWLGRGKIVEYVDKNNSAIGTWVEDGTPLNSNASFPDSIKFNDEDQTYKLGVRIQMNYTKPRIVLLALVIIASIYPGRYLYKRYRSLKKPRSSRGSTQPA